MSISRKKRKKCKIKKYILFILILILGLTWIEKKEYDKRIEQTISIVKEKVKKTDLKNVFILFKKDGIALFFINKRGENVEIDGLSGVGEIKYNSPIRVLKNGRFGYYNEKGELVIPFEYEQASDFIDGIAVVQKNKYGVISEIGEELLPYEYDNILLGENRRVILERENKYYLSDLKKGKELEVNYLYQIDEQKIVFEKDGLFGIMDFSGKVLIPNEYEEVSKYIDRTFIGKKNGKYCIVDLKTNRKLTKSYDYIEQLDKNIYRGGTAEVGKYAFLSVDFSTEEIYDEIQKLNGTIFPGIVVYAGIRGENVEIFDESKGMILQMSKKELEDKISKIKDR